MPWQKSFDVDQARDQAKAVFWSKGYEATSMEDLLGSMGINRGSFYATFGSKESLYLDVLRRYDRENRCAVLERLKAELTPREAIVSLFDAVRKEAAGAKGTRGCFLANAALELAASSKSVAMIVREAFAETQAFFKDMIEAGQADGSIRTEVDPNVIAGSLLGLLLGMRVLARGGSASPVLESIVQQVQQLI